MSCCTGIVQQQMAGCQIGPSLSMMVTHGYNNVIATRISNRKTTKTKEHKIVQLQVPSAIVHSTNELLRLRRSLSVDNSCGLTPKSNGTPS